MRPKETFRWSEGDPNGALSIQTIVGGSPTAPLGSPVLVMTDI